ncbi:GNAT family N-acetyltransferase [Streptomyces sp. SW4]|nr:GNAT family N-acetyltransferase [Streptomyces sp. SW4]
MSHALLRPATLRDAPAITTLLNEIDRIETGRPDTDQHRVEADLKHPETDLARDSWLAFDPDGALVAYGLLWDASGDGGQGGERVDMDHYVLPGHQETGLRLLTAMEARARDMARGNGADRAVVHLHLNSRPTTDTTLLTSRGWRTVRRYHVLERALDPARDRDPTVPADLRIRACGTEEDRLRVHELYQASFAGHFDFVPRDYERWLRDVRAADLDWSLVWIAATAELGDCGFLIARDARENRGWIRNVGVLPQARGRGLGGHLLRHAFAGLAARGLDTVGLGVDTANATGAPRLYARNGMEVRYAVDTWEAVLA